MTGGRVGTGTVEGARAEHAAVAEDHNQIDNHHPVLFHQHWLTRNRLLAANGIFTVYATALAVITGQADRTWAIWAAAGYGVTTLVIWLTRHRNVPVIWPVLISLAGALADWLSYNPYLPVMALFGLPRALGATGLLGDPRLWLSLTSIALIWAAFTVAAPHRRCAGCRRGVLLSALFLAASPVIAFPLTVGITDPPVIALLLLTLALIARPPAAGTEPARGVLPVPAQAGEAKLPVRTG
jgi:hypothetical protein